MTLWSRLWVRTYPYALHLVATAAAVLFLEFYRDTGTPPVWLGVGLFLLLSSLTRGLIRYTLYMKPDDGSYTARFLFALACTIATVGYFPSRLDPDMVVFVDPRVSALVLAVWMSLAIQLMPGCVRRFIFSERVRRWQARQDDDEHR